MIAAIEQLEIALGVRKAPEIDSQKLQEALDALANPVTIKSEEQYAQYLELSSKLSSLDCLTFNIGHPMNKQVYALEIAYNRRIHTWVRKTRVITDKTHKALAKYLTFSRYYPDLQSRQPLESIADKLLQAGWLYKHNEALVVAGFNLKLGNNVFTVDRLGREHRKFIVSASPMALPVSHEKARLLESWKRLDEVPELPDDYRVIYIGDGKGGVRDHRFSSDEANRVFALTYALAA